MESMPDVIARVIHVLCSESRQTALSWASGILGEKAGLTRNGDGLLPTHE